MTCTFNQMFDDCSTGDSSQLTFPTSGVFTQLVRSDHPPPLLGLGLRLLVLSRWGGARRNDRWAAGPSYRLGDVPASVRTEVGISERNNNEWKSPAVLAVSRLGLSHRSCSRRHQQFYCPAEGYDHQIDRNICIQGLYTYIQGLPVYLYTYIPVYLYTCIQGLYSQFTSTVIILVAFCNDKIAECWIYLTSHYTFISFQTIPSQNEPMQGKDLLVVLENYRSLVALTGDI